MRKPNISTSKVQKAKADSEWIPLILAIGQLLGVLILIGLAIAATVALVIGSWWVCGFIALWVIETVANVFGYTSGINHTFWGTVAVGLALSILSGIFGRKVKS